jgi:hypothetical protein
MFRYSASDTYVLAIITVVLSVGNLRMGSILVLRKYRTQTDSLVFRVLVLLFLTSTLLVCPLLLSFL